jgi:hypothetical protein
VAKDATGDLLSNFLPVPEYRYTFELPLPVALPPATYWVSIVGQLPTPDPWLWSISEAAGLPGLVANTSATPDQGPWEAAPLGDNVALSVTVAGEACAADTDADGVLDGEDVSPGDPLLCIDADADLCDDCSSGARNPAVDGPDLDGDGSCDLGDTDDDADAVPDDADNCPVLANPSQVDFDGDGAGDECDPDDDEDGVADAADSCPLVANPTQADFDGDGAGDECDPDDDGDTVADAADRCAASVIPETSVPTAGLVEGRYALVTGDGAFDTVGGAGERFTIAQTRGCTCAQVLTLSPGEKEGHYKHGCSADLLRAFITGP